MLRVGSVGDQYTAVDPFAGMEPDLADVPQVVDVQEARALLVPTDGDEPLRDLEPVRGAVHGAVAFESEPFETVIHVSSGRARPASS